MKTEKEDKDKDKLKWYEWIWNGPLLLLGGIFYLVIEVMEYLTFVIVILIILFMIYAATQFMGSMT